MKQITLVIPDGNVNMSCVAGCVEIFRSANAFYKRTRRQTVAEIRVAGFVKEVKVEGGLFSIHPSDLNEISFSDLVIIPPIDFTDSTVAENEALLNWIRLQFKTGAELATMCSGAFILAATGLLDGKSCSTHWNLAAEFRRRFPKVHLHEDRLITTEKGIYTNGGAYSFLQLALFLVEKVFDRQTAIYCSKIFQIDMDRSSQSPFLIFRTQKEHGDELIGKAQDYIEKNVAEKFSFAQLAADLAISRRNFDRRFIKATGNTPVEYLQRVKVEVAKSTLEVGRKNVYEVMSEVGYNDDKAFREVFRKVTGMSPLAYKAKFNHREAV